jgi:hypothetical protein
MSIESKSHESESAGAEKSPAQKLAVIGQNIEALKARAEQARKEKEEYLKKKILDLETLTAKGDEVAKLKQFAQETLGRLAPLREQPELQGDPQLQQQAEEAESILAQLDAQAKDIFAEIDKIGKQPEITDKIYVEGMETNKKLEADKQLEAELEKDTVGFIQKIGEYVDANNAWYMENDRLYGALNQEIEKVRPILDAVMETIRDYKPKVDWQSTGLFELQDDLQGIQPERAEAILANLGSTWESLPFFGAGKEKKALDLIFSKKDEFAAFTKAKTELARHKEQFEQIQAKTDDLTKEYRRMDEKYTRVDGGAYSHIYPLVNKLDASIRQKASGQKVAMNATPSSVFQLVHRRIHP